MILENFFKFVADLIINSQFLTFNFVSVNFEFIGKIFKNEDKHGVNTCNRITTVLLDMNSIPNVIR